MKQVLSILLILAFSAFAADKYGVYDIQGSRISTFEAEPNEVREKIKQIKSSYPYKKIFISSLKKGKVSKPASNYRFKTGSYVEATRKETFSLCPEKDTEGTWASEYSVDLNEENCIVIQTPNLAGSFDVFFLKESGLTDSIQVLVDQSYIEMGNYSHRIFVPSKEAIDWLNEPGSNNEVIYWSESSGSYESREYKQTLIVDKTKLTMGDALYFSKIGKIEFSPWLWNKYPKNEKLEESKLPLIDTYDVVSFANERSKKEGLDTAYILVNPKSKEAKNLILLDDPNKEYNSCDSCTMLALDTAVSGYRVPFDDEWMYLMRTGASSKYFWGDNDDSLSISKYTWVRPRSLKPVAQLLPNRFGLYDMVGIATEKVHYFWKEDGFGNFSEHACYGKYPECFLITDNPPSIPVEWKIPNGFPVGTVREFIVKEQVCMSINGDSENKCEIKDVLKMGYMNYNSFRFLRKTPKLHKLEKF